MLISVLASCTNSLPAVYPQIPPTPSKPLQYDIIRPTRLSRRQEERQQQNDHNNNEVITPTPIDKTDNE